jgi:predicted double-glycine peptidase
VRAGILTAVLLVAAGWSYAWYFSSPPEKLSGRLDKTGFVYQSSDDSCSAAAAAMLLNRYGIKSDEAAMARLCLTRQKQGTPPLGLFRCLAVAGGKKNLRPRFVRLGNPAQLYGVSPCIVPIGVKSDAPHDVKLKMEDYGWNPGQRHAVVIMDADKAGQWVDVADPTYGRERWPTKGIEFIWDGQAVTLRP